MRERLRRLAVPAVGGALAAVIAVGLLTGQGRPPDRALALAGQLRCPVCQSESVADSPSETARAMRQRIAEMVAAGATDQEVIDHFTARYGEWILLDPPLGRAWPLWALPVVVVAAGVAVLVRQRRRRAPAPPARLTDRQRAAVTAALDALPPVEDDL